MAVMTSKYRGEAWTSSPTDYEETEERIRKTRFGCRGLGSQSPRHPQTRRIMKISLKNNKPYEIYPYMYAIVVFPSLRTVHFVTPLFFTAE